MPELPEVEILVRHLRPLLQNKKIREISVRRARVISPTPERELIQTLRGATFKKLERRGKYLLFALRHSGKSIQLIGHLGMTGRIYLLPKKMPLPKHAAVVLDLGRYNFVYEDTRYFGRLTLEARGLEKLGPEALGPDFTAHYLADALHSSRQPIKVKLLDQTLVAGLGNIYASEALFRAKISPRIPANQLQPEQIKSLRKVIREVLEKAIKWGSTVPLNFKGTGKKDGLFYYGSDDNASGFYQERLLVYDRRGKPCIRCGTEIKRIVQAARSTFYCPQCQNEKG